MVMLPVTLEPKLLVNDKVPLPLVVVRLLIVRLVSDPYSSMYSFKVPGSFGKPSPSAFGVGAACAVTVWRKRICPIVPPTGCSKIMKKQPVVGRVVYVPPYAELPVYEVAVYSPMYSVYITGVGVGVGTGVGLGFGVGVGFELGPGVGVAKYPE
jgi:hypothetical protein